MLKVDINLLFNVINILLLCVLVRLFLFKPVNKILAERQASVDRSLAEAESVKAQALALEQERADMMKSIEEEKIAVLSDAQKRAAGEYEVILSDAKKQADSIIRTARAQAAMQKDELLRQTKSEITSIIVAAAAKVSGVGSQDDSALYDEFLRKAGESDGD